MKIKNYQDLQQTKLTWIKTTDPKHPYKCVYERDQLVIRINDFPDEELYTLIVNNTPEMNFDDWPVAWSR